MHSEAERYGGDTCTFEVACVGCARPVRSLADDGGDDDDDNGRGIDLVRADHDGTDAAAAAAAAAVNSNSISSNSSRRAVAAPRQTDLKISNLTCSMWVPGCPGLTGWASPSTRLESDFVLRASDPQDKF